jgi:hypothetical protein
MSSTVQSRAFLRAVTVLGGTQQLSDYLKVSRATVMRWASGEEKPTAKAFIDVVDLLTESDPIAFARKRRIRSRSSQGS